MIRWIVVLALPVLLGCESYAPREAALVSSDAATPRTASPGAAMPAEQFDAEDSLASLVNDQTLASQQSGGDSVQRKIIYEADIDLVVSDFTGLDDRLAALAKEHGGYLASASIDVATGTRRRGRWTARIPVDQYTSFLAAVGGLGVPTSRNETAQDVTEEFVDLQARIDNQKQLEQRVIKLLDRPNDELQHVIEVERELARIRGEIERMEGRLVYLANRTSMTTVRINAREERDYVPPQAPSLGGRIRVAWTNSLDNLRQTGEDLIVFLVAAAVWIVIAAVFVVCGWLLVRMIRRGRRGSRA